MQTICIHADSKDDIHKTRRDSAIMPVHFQACGMKTMSKTFYLSGPCRHKTERSDRSVFAFFDFFTRRKLMCTSSSVFEFCGCLKAGPLPLCVQKHGFILANIQICENLQPFD